METKIELEVVTNQLQAALNELKRKRLDRNLIHDYITEALSKVKKLNQPDVSVVHEPVASGAVCPHFNACQNGGKNEYCDLQTFNEIDCFVGQTER